MSETSLTRSLTWTLSKTTKPRPACQNESALLPINCFVVKSLSEKNLQWCVGALVESDYWRNFDRGVKRLQDKPKLSY